MMTGRYPRSVAGPGGLAIAFVLVIVTFASTLSADEPVWTLDEDHFGAIALGPEAATSARELGRLLPGQSIRMRAVYQSDEGCFVEVAAGRKTSIDFRIRSYFDCSRPCTELADDQDLARPIDLLVVESPRFGDDFGVRVGLGYRDVLSRRGGGLELRANHHDVSVGRGRLWYQFSLPTPDPGEPDRSPTSVRIEEIETGNWKVGSMSWPEPRW